MFLIVKATKLLGVKWWKGDVGPFRENGSYTYKKHIRNLLLSET